MSSGGIPSCAGAPRPSSTRVQTSTWRISSSTTREAAPRISVGAPRRARSAATSAAPTTDCRSSLRSCRHEAASRPIAPVAWAAEANAGGSECGRQSPRRRLAGRRSRDMSAAARVGLVGSRVPRIDGRRLAAGIPIVVSRGVEWCVGVGEVLTEAIAAETAGTRRARSARTVARSTRSALRGRFLMRAASVRRYAEARCQAQAQEKVTHRGGVHPSAEQQEGDHRLAGSIVARGGRTWRRHRDMHVTGVEQKLTRDCMSAIAIDRRRRYWGALAQRKPTLGLASEFEKAVRATT